MNKKFVSAAEEARRIPNILDYLEDLFSNYPDFARRSKGTHIEWVCPYPEKNLSIVVRSPIMLVAGSPCGVEARRPIKFSVCRNALGTGTALRLTSTFMSSASWINNTREKITTLCDLIDDIGKCPKCGAYFYPRYNEEIQCNPAGTKHVILTCPTKGCVKNDNTTFRKTNRLKSRLHRWIIPGV